MIKKTKLVQGVGVNDADYFVTKKENSKRVWTCPYYQTWKSMLNRAYSDTYKKRYPTYQDVAVCVEWHSFMNFRSWMMEQDWKGKHLDKDILSQENKIYSPTTCVFVDGALNLFLTDRLNCRGEWPTGVYWHKGNKKFMSRCSNPFTRENECLGYFNCPNQAHLAWRARKHELACQLADIQKDERVAEALRTRYSE